MFSRSTQVACTLEAGIKPGLQPNRTAFVVDAPCHHNVQNIPSRRGSQGKAPARRGTENGLSARGYCKAAVLKPTNNFHWRFGSCKSQNASAPCQKARRTRARVFYGNRAVSNRLGCAAHRARAAHAPSNSNALRIAAAMPAHAEYDTELAVVRVGRSAIPVFL